MKAPKKIGTVKSCPHTTLTKVSKIKVTDKGSIRFAVINNEKKVEHIVRKIDGGIVCNATAADWMISKPEVGDVIIELKGCDVEKAMLQVIATADYATTNLKRQGLIAGLVLCTQHPGATTKIQRALAHFSKKYNGPIHVKNRSGEFKFENILSFKGPERA
ncbi:hypothetical protein [Pseudomonas putida]|uniref:hypothetical protein n=1 Tax=Pseudomonas putida TaxID=303 RepID=UPI0039062F12